MKLGLCIYKIACGRTQNGEHRIQLFHVAPFQVIQLDLLCVRRQRFNLSRDNARICVPLTIVNFSYQKLLGKFVEIESNLFTYAEFCVLIRMLLWR